MATAKSAKKAPESKAAPAVSEFELATGDYTLDQLKPLPESKVFTEVSWHILDKIRKTIREGYKVPIVITKNGEIVDGVNRWEIAKELDLDNYPLSYLPEGLDAREWAVKLNTERRHMNTSQLALSAARASLRKAARLPVKSAAARFGVGERTTRRARTVIEHGNTDLVSEIDQGKITVEDAEKTIRKAVKVAKKDKNAKTDEDIQLIAQDITHEAFKLLDAGEVPTVNAGIDKVDVAIQKKAPKPKMPKGLYEVLVIDPPWPIDGYQRPARPDQGVDAPYPKMSIEDIIDLEIPALPQSIVFLWTTNKFVLDAISTIESWEFDYRYTMIWSKRTKGNKPTGMSLPGGPTHNAEFIIVGTRGGFKFETTKQFWVLNSWPVGEHSEKPDAFYELVERVCGSDNRIDMFARKERKGWKAWGLEA